MTDYVLIGNSIAANSAAARIHALDPDSPITMITDEPDPYYSRCALMYYVMDYCSRRDTYIADAEHYRRLNATIIHDRVTGVDVANHVLALESGDTRSYDKLLVATGAHGRALGVENEDAKGIYDFITLGDAEAILRDTEFVKRAAVIGGGLIGAEIAEVFAELGIPCDYLVRGRVFYRRFCSRDQSEIIIKRFEEHGIDMHMDRSVARFEKDSDGRVCALIDDAGERYDVDIVVRAIGTDPNIEFLEGSDVETGEGVIVDSQMRNRAEDVWGAGDCAEVHFPDHGPAVIQKLWYTAQPQGWVAGDNMAGGSMVYEKLPDYQSAMFVDLDFCSHGQMPGRDDDLGQTSVVAGNEIDALWLIHDGVRVVGASMLGRALTKEDIEHMVEQQMSPDEAVATAEQVFSSRYGDRAPRSRVAEHRQLSTRPHLWPFGRKPTKRGWFELTGGF
jgi:NADPH-dependent 2,4-dienoyl-CoA reductase/sulfur reductase-like enzyme